MIIKIYYKKNLKLSTQKLAAVCTHIGKELGKVCGETISLEDKVIVLMASNSKFEQHKKDIIASGKHYWIHTDIGLKEVEPNTECAIGFIEEM